MERSFWQTRWDENRIGFHRDSVNPWLVRYVERLGPPGRVLVPLCGKSLDLQYLAQQGHEVVGVEFISKAAHQFFEAQGLTPSRQLGGDVEVLKAGSITILVGDFFAAPPQLVGPLTAVYDRAALVAIEPSRRSEYMTHLRALAKAGSEAPGPAMLLINFVHDMPAGPPFSIPEDELRALLERRFTMSKLEDKDALAEESIFRERGASFLREQVWAGKLAGE